jgi:predicted nucleic acid-binding protein
MVFGQSMSPSPTSEFGEVVLVDTNILRYVSKPSDPRCEAYKRHLEGKTVALSFVTLGEIYSGFKNLGPKRQAEIEEQISVAVKLPFSDVVSRKYAEIGNLKTDTGSVRVMETNDRWIAACALAYNLPLVTHNKKDFDHIPGLQLIHESDTKTLFTQDDNQAISF